MSWVKSPMMRILLRLKSIQRIVDHAGAESTRIPPMGDPKIPFSSTMFS